MEVDSSQQAANGRNLPLPDHLEHARTRVTIGHKIPSNTQGTYGASAYRNLGVDNSLNLEAFRKDLRINFIVDKPEELVFDLVGIDAPIANALRRILLSEVPTMAIENVFIHDNSSIIHDEMLAHRLGLVPLNIDPSLFKTYKKGEAVTPDNTVKFHLKVKCTKNKDAPKDGVAPSDVLYENSKVKSGLLEWIPIAEQSEIFGDSPPEPVNDDILIAKLRPGQAIDIYADAVKSNGKDHAKWSPVATAAYRMLPEVKVKGELYGEEAEKLKELCPANVFDIEESTGCLVAARPETCTMCRECVRTEDWSKKIDLTRRRDHFIFSIESTGAMTSRRLFKEGINVFTEKLNVIEKALQEAEKRKVVDK